MWHARKRERERSAKRRVGSRRESDLRRGRPRKSSPEGKKVYEVWEGKWNGWKRQKSPQTQEKVRWSCRLLRCLDKRDLVVKPFWMVKHMTQKTLRHFDQSQSLSWRATYTNTFHRGHYTLSVVVAMSQGQGQFCLFLSISQGALMVSNDYKLDHSFQTAKLNKTFNIL